MTQFVELFKLGMSQPDRLIMAGEALACARYTRMGGGELHDISGSCRVSHSRVLEAAESMFERGSTSFVEQRADDALLQLWCFVTFFAHGLQQGGEATAEAPASSELINQVLEQRAVRRQLLDRMKETWTRIAVLKQMVRAKVALDSEERVGESFDSDLAEARAFVHLQSLWEAELLSAELTAENADGELRQAAFERAEEASRAEMELSAATHQVGRLDGVVDELRWALEKRQSEVTHLRGELRAERETVEHTQREAMQLADKLDEARRQVCIV